MRERAPTLVWLFRGLLLAATIAYAGYFVFKIYRPWLEESRDIEARLEKVRADSRLRTASLAEHAELRAILDRATEAAAAVERRLPRDVAAIEAAVRPAAATGTARLLGVRAGAPLPCGARFVQRDVAVELAGGLVAAQDLAARLEAGPVHLPIREVRVWRDEALPEGVRGVIVVAAVLPRPAEPPAEKKRP